MGEQAIDMLVVGQLLSLLAHDLRNPLSALHSNMAFLSSVIERPDPDVSDALTDGLVSCDGLNHIIDNIDLLGQALRKGSVPPRSALAAGQLIEETLKRCQRMAASHGVSLHYEPTSVAGSEVTGVRDLLSRALANLIHNCVQHSSPQAMVFVSARRTEEGIEFVVADRAHAVAAENTQQLFSAAGQVAAKSSAGGRYSRGLGLYSAHLAASAAGAAVRVVTPPPGYVNAFGLCIPAR